MFSIFTLASGWGGGRGEGCACGYVCLSIRSRNSKTIAPIDLIFYTRRSIPVAQSSSKKIQIRTPVFIKAFLTIAREDKLKT